MKNEKARIFVVDDAESNIDVIVEILGDQYSLSVALDGKSALEDIVQTKPDLVLLDIMMPNIDGYEVCRRLQANSETNHIPIIFLTGKDSLKDEAKGLMLGAVDYLLKPIDPVLLQTRIRAHLFQTRKWRKREEKLLEKIQLLEEENSRLKSKVP